MDVEERLLQSWTNGSGEVTSKEVSACLRSLPNKLSNQDGPVRLRFHELVSIVSKVKANTSEVSLVASTCLVKIICLGLKPYECRTPLRSFIENSLEKRSYEEVMFVNGILSSGMKDVLHEADFLISLFYILYQNANCPSSHLYQAFNVVKLWSQRVKEFAKSAALSVPETLQAFKKGSDVVERGLNLVSNSWDLPIRGASDLISDIFANILDIVAIADSDKNYFAFLEELLAANDKLSWRLKSKYPPLAVIIPRVGFEKILSKEPSFASGLFESLTANHLSTAGVEVYRSIVTSMSVNVWKGHFLAHLIRAITSKDGNVQNNVRNSWLPVTLKYVKGSNEAVMSELAENDYLAKLMIIKSNRILGVTSQLSDSELDLIGKAIVHTQVEVRGWAFSVLCQVKRKTVEPSARETEMIKRFLTENLSEDHITFRQNFTSDFTVLIVRLRDSALATHRSAVKKKGKEDILGDGSDLLRQVTCLNDIMEILFQNIYGGANYQRLISALDLLQIFYSGMFEFEANKGMNKTSGNGNPAPLIHDLKTWEVSGNGKQRKMLDFASIENAERLLGCVLHYMEDVRQKAGELLRNFAIAQPLWSRMFKRGLELIFAPKTEENGAVMIELCLRLQSNENFVQELGRVESQNKVLETTLPISLSNGWTEQENRKIGPSLALLNIYRVLLKRVMKTPGDILLMSRRAPMHGIGLAIRKCLKHDLSLQNEIEAKGFVQSLLDVFGESLDFMLDLLAGSAGESNNASFADMGVAVEDMIRDAQKDEMASDDDTIGISDAHSLVLSMLWLNIKECALVACEVATSLRPEFISAQDFETCAGMMRKILVKCRHRGAWEATGWALFNFSQWCFKHAPSDPKSKVTSVLLWETLKELESASTGMTSSSVTRRAAGLPMIVQQIAASEPRGAGGRGRSVLGGAMQSLIKIAGDGDNRGNPSNAETEDTPACLSMHILRSLVQDSSLSYDIVPYLAGAFRVCVTNFSSTSWAIRNAALQLFGGLVPRMIGQKKVRDDTTVASTLMTVEEFFVRYADLKEFLLCQLTPAQENNETPHLLVSPSTVPLLTMMSNLTPGTTATVQTSQQEGQETAFAFKSAFRLLFHSPVIKVRLLAVKAYLAFTHTAEVEAELRRTLEDIANKACPTNYIHSLFTLVENVTRAHSELPQAEKDRIVKVLENFKHPCILLRKLVLQTFKNLSRASDNVYVPEINLAGVESFHPGYKDILLELRNEENDERLENRDQVTRVLNKIKAQRIKDTTVAKQCVEIMRLPFVNGVHIENCNHILHSCQPVILMDPELAMDILDVTQPLASKALTTGLTARTTSLVTQAICFAAMMTKDDFDMFFGDGSQYTSLFSEFAQHLEDLSSSDNSEVSRLNVAKALIQLLPVFQVRQCKEFNILVVLAMAQIFNVCLVLLEDEEREVRYKATEFGSKLVFSGSDVYGASGGEFPVDHMSTFHAIRKITSFGLEHFSNGCLEWFSPVIDVFFKPWNGSPSQKRGNDKGGPFDPVAYLEASVVRNQLFESGEGLNVFSDEVSMNNASASLVDKWLTGNSGKQITPDRRISLNKEVVIEQVEALTSKYCLPLAFDSPLRTPKGQVVMTRFQNLVGMLHRHPYMFGKDERVDRLHEILSKYPIVKNQFTV